MKTIHNVLLSTMVLVIMGQTACKKENSVMEGPTLYEKVGGTSMVADPTNPSQMIEQGRLSLRSVVDSSIFVIAADPALQAYFAPLLMEVTAGNTTNLGLLSRSLTDFFVVATGSKSGTYTGMSMRDAHDPEKNSRMALKADNKSYNDFIGAVVKGAQQNNVPGAIIQEVGELLETLRSTIVQR